MFKRMFATVVTSVALVGGATVGGAVAAPAVTPTAPQAPAPACGPGGPYPDTVGTVTRARFIMNPVPNRVRARLLVKVRGKGAAGNPRRGRFVVRVFGRTFVKRAGGGDAFFRLQRLRGFPRKPRAYQVTVRYQAPTCSVFKNSRRGKTLVVRRQNRRR